MKSVYVQNMRLVESEDSWDTGVEGYGCVINLLDFPIVSSYTEEYITDLVAGRPVSLNNGGSPEQKPNYESSSEIIQQYENSDVQESSPSRTQSSISDLESSESCSSEKCIRLPTFPTRPRSKRARPTGPTPWVQIALSLAAIYSLSKKTQNFKKKKERRKISVEKLENCLQIESWDGSSHETKKCTHCEITKTPQWREGPLGPKTLCNACGVRFRSGRLFPEYRPAASPTFIPYLHSNSHKKVIQIRSKGQWPLTKIEDPPISPEPEFVHSINPMFDFMYN